MSKVSRSAIVGAIFTVALFVSACNEGSGSAASATGQSNRAPTISGTPVTAVRQGEVYDFTPSATDPDGDALTFSIRNRPGWASFDPATGRLNGTPAAADVGTYGNVEISVSDGRAAAQLGAFAVTVNQVSMGSVTLSWTPPLTNSDGSALTTLAGYKIYYGRSAGSLSQIVTIDSAGVTRWVVGDLSPATYYFAMTSYNASGVESTRSGVVSRVVT